MPGRPFDTPAVREWKHVGVLCAVRRVGSPAINSFAGCVLLPCNHPWRGLDAAAIPTVVNGVRVTFADASGWVGFDAPHGWDLRQPASNLATQTDLRERSG